MTGALTDFDGDPRIAWDGVVDIGADEFYTHLFVSGTEEPGGTIDIELTGIPGTAPIGLFAVSATLLAPMNTKWGSFWIDLASPWVLFTFPNAIPANGVLDPASTQLPLTPPAPYIIPLHALIGLNPDSILYYEAPISSQGKKKILYSFSLKHLRSRLRKR